MDIDIQIKIILFSLVFGFIFSFFLRFNYKYIVGCKKFLSFILSFLFVLVSSLLYFIILKKINFGIFHQYEILCIVIGFFFENLVVCMVEKKLKKWYTLFNKVGE